MLLDLVERHLRKVRIPPTRFGRESVGDPRFVFDLRDGREPRQATIDKVLRYLDRAERRAS